MAQLVDDDVARLRTALLRIVRTIDSRVGSGELTTTQLSILGAVRRRGPIGVGELADSEGINPTMVSRMLSKLEDAGLISRSTMSDDRRAVVVEVTAAGHRTHDRIRSERSQVLADCLDRLPPAQAAKIFELLPALEGLGDEMLRSPMRS